MSNETHTRQLEEIDRQQRAKEEQPAAEAPFAQTIVEALNPASGEAHTPLLAQEEIEIDDPPRINLTAVVCTAIVAICAMIILLVAKPWRTDDSELLTASAEPPTEQLEEANSNQQTVSAKSVEAKPQETKPVEAKPAEPKPAEAKPAETKTEEAKPAAPKKSDPAATLPVVKTVKVAGDNPYNNLRLVDASSRLLTKSEVELMNAAELALARNAIYARHGYQFNNTELREYFSKQPWFKPSDVKIDAIPFSQTELDNIRLIKAHEQHN